MSPYDTSGVSFLTSRSPSPKPRQETKSAPPPFSPFWREPIQSSRTDKRTYLILFLTSFHTSLTLGTLPTHLYIIEAGGLRACSIVLSEVCRACNIVSTEGAYSEAVGCSGSLWVVIWERLEALLHRTTHNTTPHSNSKGGPPAATTVMKPSIEGGIISPTAVVVQ